jgi:S-adenosylmethionine-diacylglycerol 3-amino-3-carboxypropyl transferase
MQNTMRESLPLSISTSKDAANRLSKAVHRAHAMSWQGFLERLFTLAFRGLVYPQIWEDPDVDMRALSLGPTSRVITIASGGCNVMSYLVADPKEIVAVDLNRAHIALTRLKLASLRHLPTYDAYYRFVGAADEKANIAAYERFLRDRIDPETRAYWESRDILGRRRISLFARDIYRHGLFGHFIGFGHLVAKLYGVDPKHMVRARTLGEQRAFFDASLAPLFEKRFVRWATSLKLSLYGLGIPPAQYEALATAGSGGMASVLKQRLERLACAFPLSENYFAWQAFARSYETGEAASLPPYLGRENFAALRDRADRVKIVHRSFTEQLESEKAASLDGYVLLDAQDWMTDAQLNALWREITRTARSGARVIFRTAAEPTILPGRVEDSILARWTYEAKDSLAFTRQDRSSTYGGFHLYRFAG